MNKVLVYCGLGLTGLGITEIILFTFGVVSKQFDNIGEPKITEIIIMWIIGTIIMFYMGNKFVEKGLANVSQRSLT